MFNTSLSAVGYNVRSAIGRLGIRIPAATDLVVQVVTAPPLNPKQQVCVSRLLGDHYYKRMPRVTVGVTR